MSTPSTDDAPPPTGWRVWLSGHAGVGLLVAGLAIVLDQVTKRIAFSDLRPIGRVVEVPGPVDLTLTFNDGGAFGLPAPTWVFATVTVVVTVLVVRVLPRVELRISAVAYGLLLGGALGNATDRLFREPPAGVGGVFNGRVVDFLKVERVTLDWGPIQLDAYQFPIFNMADVAITCGFVLLVIAMYAEERRLAEAEATSLLLRDRADEATPDVASSTDVPDVPEGRTATRTRAVRRSTTDPLVPSAEA